MSPNGKKRGRPRALTPEKQDEVIRVLSIGGNRKMAARFVGVSVTTIADEAKRNEDFSDRLNEAEAKCYMVRLGKIHDSKDWRASAWFLARRYPEEFSEVRRQAQTDANGNDLPLTAEQRQKAIDAILDERRTYHPTS